jgi:hypothetical protein
MRIHSTIKWAVGLAVVFSLVAVSQQTTIPQDDAKDFQARIDKYLAIQKKAVGSVPSMSKQVNDPAVILDHEKRLAEAIRGLRPDAKVGEIFTPWLRSVITSAVKVQVQGKAGADAKATILGEGNPKSAESPSAVKLTVNGPYPENAPLSTVPPSVLMALPPLPKEIEYRFVGRNLILRDTKANIVVDILPNAL